MINLKKELIVFVLIFIIASLAVHNSVWFSHPIAHIKALSSHGIPYHPLLYTFIIYIIIAIIRSVFTLFKKIFSKK